MKFILLAIFYLLTTNFYFFSNNIFPVSSPVIFLTARRSLGEQRMLSHDHQNEHNEGKVLDENKEQQTFQKHFKEKDHPGKNDLELIYHIDYNGVTTHPVPTPKHPRP